MNIVAEYPGLKVVAKPVAVTYSNQKAYREYKAGDVIAVAEQTARHGTLWSQFTFGSVVSYCLKNGDCPIEGLDRARKFGHDLHWLNANAVVIAANKSQDVAFAAEIGEVVRFEGCNFRIERAPNHNLKLVEVE